MQFLSTYMLFCQLSKHRHCEERLRDEAISTQRALRGARSLRVARDDNPRRWFDTIDRKVDIVYVGLLAVSRQAVQGLGVTSREEDCRDERSGGYRLPDRSGGGRCPQKAARHAAGIPD